MTLEESLTVESKLLSLENKEKLNEKKIRQNNAKSDENRVIINELRRFMNPFGNCENNWCLQEHLLHPQYTMCESLSNYGKTCLNPTIKYGTTTGGIPHKHPGNKSLVSRQKHSEDG